MEIQRQAQKGHLISAIDMDVVSGLESHSFSFLESECFIIPSCFSFWTASAIPISSMRLSTYYTSKALLYSYCWPTPTVRNVFRFRHSPKAADMLPSTHSAFVRICLQHGRDDMLLRILDDPVSDWWPWYYATVLMTVIFRSTTAFFSIPTTQISWSTISWRTATIGTLRRWLQKLCFKKTSIVRRHAGWRLWAAWNGSKNLFQVLRHRLAKAQRRIRVSRTSMMMTR